MFRRPYAIPSKFGEVKFPDQIKDLIQSKRYANAAEVVMSRGSIPFNMAFVFLSNCPEALSYYLLLNIPELEDAEVEVEEEEEDQKEEEKKDANGEEEEELDAASLEKQKAEEEKKRKMEEKAKKKGNFSGRSCAFINLYLAVTIPLLITKQGRERKMEQDKLIEFCKICKNAIDKNHVYKICREISDDDFVKAIYLLFGDIWEYSMIMFEQKQYDKIFAELAKLPEQKRAQVYKNFPVDYQIQMIKTMTRGEMPNGNAFYPLLVETCFVLADQQQFSQLSAVLVPVLQRMYTRRQLTTPPQRQVYYHTVVRTLTPANLNVIYGHDLFTHIGYDYVLRLLERRKMYSWAGQFCARVNDRHPMAVTYAIMDSIKAVLELLQSALTPAKDLKQCWIRALERSRTDDVDEKEWRDLLEKSTGSGVVSLDDIFPLMPTDMEIDEFQPTILRSLVQYKKEAEESNTKIKKLTDRSNEQRTVIQKGPQMVIELDPLATCWICKGQIFKDRYLVFPCMHTVHVKCLLSSMHLYYEPTVQLNLISMSARAMRDEKKAAGLADLVCKSCPICGELSLTLLDKGFVQPNEVKDKTMWSLPEITRKIKVDKKRRGKK